MVTTTLGKWFGRFLFEQAPSTSTQRSAGTKRVVGKGNALPPRGQPPKSSKPLPDWPRVDSIADLPAVHRVLTAPKAEFELQESLRSAIVVTGHDGNTASILVEASAYHQVSVHVDSLRDRLRKAQIRVNKPAFARKELIDSIYQIEQKEVVSDESAATQEARLFAEFIRYGVENDATDIHFIVKGSKGLVKYRVDGEMEVMKGPDMGSYTKEQITGAVGRAFNKLMADRTGSHSSFQPDDFQSCMIPYREGDKHMNLRYQSSRGFEGYTVFIRYLMKEKTFKAETFQDFGYSDDQAEAFAQVGRTRKGMILICGETNSGKSTALTHYVETLPGRDQLNIITVEDPVEREVEGTSLQISLQRTLSSDSEKMPFSEVQPVLMRSDPNIIMQGEIRDRESGICANTLLETGHQVLATLHSAGIMEAFPRLVGSQIGFALQTITRPRFWSLIVYQSLVPKLCSCAECADETIPNITAFIRERFAIDTSAMRTRRVGGCPACKGRGTKGLTVVAEVYQPTRLFLQYMRDGNEYEAERVWRSESDGRFDTPFMRGKTVFEHALYKAYLGQIDPRQVENFELLDRFDILKG